MALVRFAKVLLALTHVQASMARSRFEKSRQSWTGVPMRTRAGSGARGCGMGTVKATTAPGGGNVVPRLALERRSEGARKQQDERDRRDDAEAGEEAMNALHWLGR